MAVYLLGRCTELGDVVYNGYRVGSYPKPGYVLIRKSQDTYEVEMEMGSRLKQVVITCDVNGKVLYTDPEISEFLIGARMDEAKDSSIICNFPVDVESSLSWYKLELDKELVIESVTTGGTKVPVCSHFAFMRGYLYGFGGIRYPLGGYEGVNVKDAVMVSERGIKVFSHKGDMKNISGVWNGNPVIIDNTQVRVVLPGVEDGVEFSVNVPVELLEEGLGEVVYYPISPTGERFFTVKEFKEPENSGSLKDKFMEEIEHILNGKSEDYTGLLKEILLNAPKHLQESSVPLQSALFWALAERRGSL